jgi:hypothetical protein
LPCQSAQGAKKAASEAKTAAKAAETARRTFGEVALELIEAKRKGWRSELHARQWRAFETHPL